MFGASHQDTPTLARSLAGIRDTLQGGFAVGVKVLTRHTQGYAQVGRPNKQVIHTIELRDLLYARQRLKCFDLNAEPAIAIADFDMLG
jgi:hypothetical protein